jgi:sigma-B regulation protein RsbU (phosphoserine phosphatase)
VLDNLSRSIDSMEGDMVLYMNNLTAITAEKEKIGAELSIATQIQKDSLPAVFPAFPERDEFDIYASMDPAKEVGGDFYNFFFIDDDHLGLVIADVSGKGVPAALMMMVTNIVLSNRAKVGGKPSEIMDYVNNDLCEHNSEQMFVTAWLGILEISTGKLVSCNAGHEDPIVCHKGGDFEVVRENHGLVLGAMKGIPFTDQEITLSAGDKLFLYTDGLPEAKNAEGKLFTVERTLVALNRHKGEGPQELLASIRQEVNAYVQDAPQFDDLTMMCVEIKK